MGTLLVAKRRNVSASQHSDVEDAPKGKAKFNSPIKLTAHFKDKLERVAKDFGLYPGELVEREMSRFIAQENLRVLEKEIERE